MKTIDKELMKAAVFAPCGTKNEDGKLEYPHVDCEWDCDNCPWNPKEKTRRLKTGTFVNGMLIFKRRAEIA